MNDLGLAIAYPSVATALSILGIFERRPMKAVVLLSGGMDSCCAMAQARADGAEELIALSVKYGSLHQEAETRAAIQVSGWFNAEHHLLNLDIFKGGSSSLMGEQAMPQMSYQEIDEAVGPSPTVVPFRNANFISVATTYAIIHGADYVYVGIHGEDAHHSAYPDCDPLFLGAMANAVWIGTYEKVRLQYPFCWMSKADVCKRAHELGAPLHLTWSCYNPQLVSIGSKRIHDNEYLQCGVCPTCIERIHAFQVNHWIDPVPYALQPDWLTDNCSPFDPAQEE